MNTAARTTPRPRHPVGSRTLTLLRPWFRYSQNRDAFVLRIAGRRRGPVLISKADGERQRR
jgi:hypothetical protein